MQPRLRTVIWREMPPFIRRGYRAWSRKFFYLELYLDRLYRDWTKSPTWNFVGIVGTAGILLTILLFLVPGELETVQAAVTRQADRKQPWELDSRLLAVETPRSQAYPVEFLFRDELPQYAIEKTPRRRRTPVAETAPVDEPDWFTQPVEPQPPDFDWNVEIVTAPKRTREPRFDEEVSWTARTHESNSRNELDRDLAWNDDWRLYDQRRDVLRNQRTDDPFGDHATITTSMSEQPLGELWQPAVFPDQADSVFDAQLELSWNRPSSRRRSSTEPQLYVRNLGSQSIPQVDVIAGAWNPESSASLYAQTIRNLAEYDEKSVTWPTKSSLVSVLITGFAGGVTEVSQPVAVKPARPEPRPVLVEPKPVRNPERPHLKLSIGQPGRLPADKMVSVPLQVVNDGNVPLEDVVILAEMPDNLEHKYGRKVQYWLGKLQPGEARQNTLLMTPLAAGTSIVPLRAVDGRELASDAGETRIEVALAEVEQPTPQDEPVEHATPTPRRRAPRTEPAPRELPQRDEGLAPRTREPRQPERVDPPSSRRRTVRNDR